MIWYRSSGSRVYGPCDGHFTLTCKRNPYYSLPWESGTISGQAYALQPSPPVYQGEEADAEDGEDGDDGEGDDGVEEGVVVGCT